MRYIYVRVSTDKQHNETQIAALLNHAPDAVIYEDVISGASEKAGLASLMSVLKRGDTLYLYKFDRLSRSLLESLSLIKELSDKGIQVISISQNIDLNTKEGRLQFSMLQSIAEFERETIIERIQARMDYLKTPEGKAYLQSKGKMLGGKREGAGRKGFGQLSDAERMFLNKLKAQGQVDWVRAAQDFKDKFGKEYKPNTLRRKA